MKRFLIIVVFLIGQVTVMYAQDDTLELNIEEYFPTGKLSGLYKSDFFIAFGINDCLIVKDHKLLNFIGVRFSSNINGENYWFMAYFKYPIPVDREKNEVYSNIDEPREIPRSIKKMQIIRFVRFGL